MSNKTTTIAIAAIAAAFTAMADDIQLPQPVKAGGTPLATALAQRKTVRDWDARKLSSQELSSLLWAANGINRPDGRRTAPTGMNVQDVDVYVMLASGVYRYDAACNRLVSVNPGDHRADAGRQPFTAKAPVNLFYVQDTARSMKTDAANIARHGGIHAGAIMQNVYLHCAANGLGTVARDSLDREALAATLKLDPAQRIILGQSVGALRADGLIGEEAARRAALSAAKINVHDARNLKCKLDTEDGVMVYEVEFDFNGYEYDIDIDAKSGAVLKSKKKP